MVKLKKKAGVAKRVRRQHTGAFKAQVALAALREDKTMAQLCQEFDLHANQITEWTRQLLAPPSKQFAYSLWLCIYLRCGRWLWRCGHTMAAAA